MNVFIGPVRVVLLLHTLGRDVWHIWVKRVQAWNREDFIYSYPVKNGVLAEVLTLTVCPLHLSPLWKSHLRCHTCLPQSARRWQGLSFWGDVCVSRGHCMLYGTQCPSSMLDVNLGIVKMRQTCDLFWQLDICWDIEALSQIVAHVSLVGKQEWWPHLPFNLSPWHLIRHLPMGTSPNG